MSFSEELRDASADTWDAVIHHPFTDALADGTLDPEGLALVREAQRSPSNVITGSPCQIASMVVVPPLYGNASKAMSMAL